MKQWCESQGKVQFQKTLLALESLSERQGVAVAHPGDTHTLLAAIPGSCPYQVYTGVGRYLLGFLSSVHSRFLPATNKK